MALILFLAKISLDYYLMNLKFIIMLIFAIFMKGEKKRILYYYPMASYSTNVLIKMVIKKHYLLKHLKVM